MPILVCSAAYTVQLEEVQCCDLPNTCTEGSDPRADFGVPLTEDAVISYKLGGAGEKDHAPGRVDFPFVIVVPFRVH